MVISVDENIESKRIKKNVEFEWFLLSLSRCCVVWVSNRYIFATSGNNYVKIAKNVLPSSGLAECRIWCNFNFVICRFEVIIEGTHMLFGSRSYEQPFQYGLLRNQFAGTHTFFR